MNPRAVLVIFLFSLVTSGSILVAHDLDKHYPHVGDIWFSGNYADSFFTFHATGDWTSSDPGFEFDISIDENVFDSCTSWSTVPSFYDDCPTAGVSDPTGKTVFSIGSYDALQIPEDTQLYAQWSFAGGSAPIGEYAVIAQEVEHKFCSWDSPWCMGGTNLASVLLEYIHTKASSHARNWFWTDNSLSGTGDAKFEPDGSYYQTTVHGRHDGDLFGEGDDFDLYLYYWNSSTSTWDEVDSSLSTSSVEVIRYSGPAGFYKFEVYSYDGGGDYQLGINHP